MQQFINTLLILTFLSLVLLGMGYGGSAEAQKETVTVLPNITREIPETDVQNPDAIAVVIGNRDYLFPTVPDVDYAIRDATAIKSFLMKMLGVKEGNILFFENTTQGVLNTLFGTKQEHKGRLFDMVKPSLSDVFIYYSGHGAPDIASNQGYFVPVDCDPKRIKLNGYALNLFYQNLSQIPAKSFTIVIDACFSGISHGGSLLGNISPIVPVVENPLMGLPNATVMTAARGDEVSGWYPEKGHGLFTYFFLKGVSGSADRDKNGELTVSELQAFLLDRTEGVPYWARRLHGKDQNPDVFVSEDIVLTILPVDTTKTQIFIEEPEALRLSSTATFFSDSLPIRLTGIAVDNVGVASVRINERNISFTPLVGEDLRLWRTKLHKLLNGERQSPHQVVRFEFPLNLAESQNQIGIAVSDDAGNRSRLDCTLNVQQLPNVLSTLSTLVVSSSPSGVTVYVDGKGYGKTPLTTEIDLGIRKQRKVEVGLELVGYKSRVASLTLKRGQKTYWENVKLDPLPNLTQAVLVVSSSPSGAMVYVDGKEYGKTPLTTEIDLGIRKQREVEVGLKLDGYKTKLASLTLRHGQNTSWENQQLEKLSSVLNVISTIASVTISSRPTGATVYIDGKEYGKTPLITEVDMGVSSSKPAKVKLVLSGYKSYATNLTLTRGKRASMTGVILESLHLDEEMIRIPAGEFWMGSSGGDAHKVNLDAFYIDKYEVTNAQYRAFVQATGHPEPQGTRLSSRGIDIKFRPWDHPEWNAPNQPVVCVSWEDAMAYARWAGKTLPTEAQWEKVACGGLDRKVYPWGDTFKVGLVAEKDRLEKIGSYPPNGYGIYDMMGNVWEWCLDWYQKDYYEKSPQRNPANLTPSKRAVFRVIRGGSYRDNSPKFYQNATRGRLMPSTKNTSTGFRCVKPVN